MSVLFNLIKPRPKKPSGGLLAEPKAPEIIAPEYHEGVPVFDPTDPLGKRLLESQGMRTEPAPVSRGEAYLPKTRYVDANPETGFKSKLNQALLDMQDAGMPDIMNGQALRKQLAGRGISDQEIIESGLDLNEMTGTNKVSIQAMIDNSASPAYSLSTYTQAGYPDVDVSSINRMVEGIPPEIMSLDQYRRDFGLYADPQDWARHTWLRPMTDERGVNDQFSQFIEDFENIDTSNINTEFDSPYLREATIAIYQDSDIPEADIRAVIGKMMDDYDRELLPAGVDMLEHARAYDKERGIESGSRGSMERAFARFMDEQQQIDNVNNPITSREFELYGQNASLEGNELIGYDVYLDNEYIGHKDSLTQANYLLEGRANDRARDVIRDQYGPYTRSPEYSNWLRGTPTGKVQNTYLKDEDMDFLGDEHFRDQGAYEGYIAHSRASGRISSAGPVHHVDEIQSDLHKRREEGYATREYENQIEAIENERYKYDDAMDGLVGGYSPTAQAELYLDFAQRYHGDQAVNNYNVYKENHSLSEVTDLTTQSLRQVQMDIMRWARGEKSVNNYDDVKDGPLLELVENAKGFVDANRKLKEVQDKYGNPTLPDAPLKDNKWVEAMVKREIMNAIENGKDGISFNNAMNQERLYFNNTRERLGAGESVDQRTLEAYEGAIKAYKAIYEEMIPSILKKIGKQYGVKPRKIDIKDPDYKEDGKNWYLPISKPMKRQINSKGMNLYGKIKDGLLKEAEERKLKGGLMEGAKYYA